MLERSAEAEQAPHELRRHVGAHRADEHLAVPPVVLAAVPALSREVARLGGANPHRDLHRLARSDPRPERVVGSERLDDGVGVESHAGLLESRDEGEIEQPLLVALCGEQIGRTIAGGFDPRTRPARNFPVCAACAFPIAEAITYAQERLAARYAGQAYLVLPSAGTDFGREILREKAVARSDRFRLEAARDILAQEHDLLRMIADLADEGADEHFALSFVYFAQEKASWRIQAEIHDVLPERMRAIWRAIDDIASDPLLCSEKPSGRGTERRVERRPLRVGTRTLKTFAATTGDDGHASQRQLREWLVAGKLDADVAEAFVASGEKWMASADETTFAFTLGLGLQGRIARSAGRAEEAADETAVAAAEP